MVEVGVIDEGCTQEVLMAGVQDTPMRGIDT